MNLGLMLHERRVKSIKGGMQFRKMPASSRAFSQRYPRQPANLAALSSAPSDGDGYSASSAPFPRASGRAVRGVRHSGEGDPGDGIAGPCGQMAQLAGAFSPSLCPVERIRHAPKTGVRLRMFPLRAGRERPPEIRDFRPAAMGMASPTGLEPVTPGLGNRCSIRLSYGDIAFEILSPGTAWSRPGLRLTGSPR